MGFLTFPFRQSLKQVKKCFGCGYEVQKIVLFYQILKIMRRVSLKRFLSQIFRPLDPSELATGEFNADMNAITWKSSRLSDIREWPSTIGEQPGAFQGV